MSDQSLFNEQNPPTQANPATPSNPDPLTDLLKNIRNEEGKQKYATPEEALNALKHSQEFIPQLKNELQSTKDELTQARESLNRMKELELTLEKLTQQRNPDDANPTPVKSFSEDDVATLIEKVLHKKTTENSQRENITSVTNAVKEAFGDKAEEIFYAKAEELNLSKAEMNELAAKSPKIVLSALGITGKNVQKPVNPTMGSLNTNGMPSDPPSIVGRNDKTVLFGATTQEVMQESLQARKMVEQLHAQGKTVHDLTDPKVYFATFKQG